MRIFFASRDFSGASLARRLTVEGHEVRAYVESPASGSIMRGLIGRLPSLAAGVDWAGRDGLVVVDDIGFGAWQDRLRADGFAVVGGSGLGDKLEHRRSWAMEMLTSRGVPTLPTIHFGKCLEAAEHIARNPRAWVVKYDGHTPKTATFVGRFACGSDAYDFLRACNNRCTAEICRNCGVVLQHAVEGPCHEIGVARYFNGRGWVGPVELNIEYKRLCNGGLGPNTAEMGTLMWYEPDHPLFHHLLEPLGEMLADANHVGDVSINCLVSGEAIFPLEFTTRFGWPATQAQMALHQSPWGEFLHGIARHEFHEPRWRRGYAVALLIATPPFPFAPPPDSRGSSMRGMPIRFRRALTPEEEWSVHYESVEFQEAASGADAMIPMICDDSGYTMHVTGHGLTVAKARAHAYELARAVALPGMFYRTDIGETHEETMASLERLLPHPQPTGSSTA